MLVQVRTRPLSHREIEVMFQWIIDAGIPLYWFAGSNCRLDPKECQDRHIDIYGNSDTGLNQCHFRFREGDAELFKLTWG